ncbi:MAG TPA: dihydrofolate reductase family protein [Chloroflexota bacterium]|nr:dihydrofolate reductase family protein [Chloroflexota bacterium]
MRTVTFGVACSLDMFIARKDHAVDWLHWSDDVTAIMADYWKTIDTILMGRKTYDVSLRMGGGGPYSGIKTYVFSRTPKKSGDPNVEIVSTDAAAFVRDLKSRDGNGICCMGGGEFAQSLFEAGVIDEVGLNIHPVLLGSGIPLFLEMNRQIDLELVESKAIKGGCVYVLYRVKK